MSTTIAAGEFKAKCLGLLDEVESTRSEIIITKRGKPVARLIPIEQKLKEPLWGRMKGSGVIKGDIFSTGEVWEADAD